MAYLIEKQIIIRDAPKLNRTKLKKIRGMGGINISYLAA